GDARANSVPQPPRPPGGGCGSRRGAAGRPGPGPPGVGPERGSRAVAAPPTGGQGRRSPGSSSGSERAARPARGARLRTTVGAGQPGQLRAAVRSGPEPTRLLARSASPQSFHCAPVQRDPEALLNLQCQAGAGEVGRGAAYELQDRGAQLEGSPSAPWLVQQPQHPTLLDGSHDQVEGGAGVAEQLGGSVHSEAVAVAGAEHLVLDLDLVRSQEEGVVGVEEGSPDGVGVGVQEAGRLQGSAPAFQAHLEISVQDSRAGPPCLVISAAYCG